MSATTIEITSPSLQADMARLTQLTKPLLRELSKPFKDSMEEMEPRQARYLVDLYYQLQHYRIATANQVRSMSKDGEPHVTLGFFFTQMQALEEQVQVMLSYWTDKDPLGRWAKSVYGIGPVIAAGLLAHIDINKAPTAGHIWSFAGYDPTVVWEKGQKRPWNADLKVICWKAGESFVKFSSKDECIYGKLYLERKELEVDKNENGDFADQAAEILKKKRIGKDTDAYKAYSQGKLPPAHIHARAKRYAVKIFLSHYHEMGYRLLLGKEPPAPYPIAILGHAHKIEPQVVS